MEITMIPIWKLYSNPENPRREVGDVSELAESIKAKGIMQNLTVSPRGYNDGYVVVIGHRRLAAAKMAGLTALPCAIVQMSRDEQLQTMLIENMARKDLTLHEQCCGVQMLIDLGSSVEEIANDTGLSETTVRRRVKLYRELGDEGLRTLCGKQLTIEDMDRIGKITNERQKAEAIAAAGTSNFEFTMQKIKREEEQERKRCALAEAAFIRFGFGTSLNEPPYSNDIIRRFFYDEDTIRNFPTLDGVEYRYYVADESKPYPYVTVWWKVGTGPERAEDSATGKAADEPDPECERIEELDELAQAAEDTRNAFINNFVCTTSFNNIMLFAVRLICIIEDGVRDYLEGRFDSEIGDIFEKMKVSGTYAARALVKAAYYLACRYCDLESFVNYDGSYGENDGLAELYAALYDIGYEMSDTEKQLADGSHELYKN